MEDEIDDFEPLSQVAVRNASGRAVYDFGEPQDGTTGCVKEYEADRKLGEEPAGRDAHHSDGMGASTAGRKPSKYFNDPVHGLMRISGHFLDFIDTRPFQRLRYLAQLGLTSYVFPGATHTRFEHSLGVCHLAFQYADKIWDTQKRLTREVDMRYRDLLCVGLAGLCHDMGHGPFSHVWDREFLKAKNITDWEHEDMSCSIFDYIIDTHNIDSISNEEQNLVKLLIKGQREQRPKERAFLFDIVANNRTSIDVDKADYLLRDAMHCGVPVAVQWQRIMQLSKVIDNEICYKWSEYTNVMNLFHARANMHRSVYTHRKAKAIELMIVDALLEADTVLKFSERIYDPAQFIKLDDSLMRKIEDYEDYYPGIVADGDDRPLERAGTILHRLRNRELYRYVNEVTIPVGWKGRWRAPTSEELCAYFPANGQVNLDPQQIVVNVNSINWAMKDKNPLDKVRWFNLMEDTMTVQKEQHHVTCMAPIEYQDTMLRVYSKSRDERIVQALNVALDNYAKKTFGRQVELATPCKAGTHAYVSNRQQAEAAARGVGAGPSQPVQVGNGMAQQEDSHMQHGDGDGEGDEQHGRKRRRKSLAQDFDNVAA